MAFVQNVAGYFVGDDQADQLASELTSIGAEAVREEAGVSNREQPSQSAGQTEPDSPASQPGSKPRESTMGFLQRGLFTVGGISITVAQVVMTGVIIGLIYLLGEV
jgi:hypothetical protein